MRKVKLEDGMHVKYVDSHGQMHDALVTTCWGNREFDLDDPKTFLPAINIVYVLLDPARRDQWGQQKEHDSSVVHKSNTTAPGKYWLFPHEVVA